MAKIIIKFDLIFQFCVKSVIFYKTNILQIKDLFLRTFLQK